MFLFVRIMYLIVGGELASFGDFREIKLDFKPMVHAAVE